jgi:hypothetical protein
MSWVEGKNCLTRFQKRENFRHTYMDIFITVVENSIIPHTPNHPKSQKEEFSMYLPHISIPGKSVSTLRRHVKIMNTARAQQTPDNKKDSVQCFWMYLYTAGRRR